MASVTHQVSRLENGLTIATSEMPHMASVSLGIWVGVGARYEPAELNGASHFIEHMLFKGTAKRDARAISQAVESFGGYLNAFTAEENTCFYAKACGDRWPDLLEVLTDMMLNSRFDSSEVTKERAVIKEEVAMYLDQPAQLVQELLNETLWPAHPLGRSVTGSRKTLDFMSRTRLLQFARTHYLASNTLITAAGNIRHQELVKAAARYARKFQEGPQPAFQPAVDAQELPRIKLHSKKTSQVQMALGFRTCSRHEEHRFALRLLNTLLGENMSSRLFQVVREDRGLAYSIQSAISFLTDTGALVISAGLDAGQFDRTLRLILRELVKLREKAPPREELVRARDYLIGQIDLNLESTESRMMWLGEQWLGYGRIVSPALLKRRLQEVSPEQIRHAARAWLLPSRMNLAVVSSIPAKSAPGILKQLRL